MGKRRVSNDVPGEDKREARARGGTPGARPTIGFLTVWTWSHLSMYLSTLWTGVTDAAREHDANLICFAGGNLGVSPFDEFNAQRNALFDLATPDAVDGLVIGSGILSLFVSPREFQAFCDRYRPLPMVSVAVALEGIPSVLVDNVTGLRDAVNHLIEAHGYRRIACLRGPEGHEEGDARYRACAEALAAHGLPLNPALVVPGIFSRDSGVEAMRLLLDVRGLRPGVDFEAVVAATDDMAFGALDVLQAHGIQVPYDVALVGFNDDADARVSTPALTTVRQPIYQQGKRAVEMLLALLAGEDVPEQVTLPTEMVVRHSCGCHSRSVLHAAAPVVETLSGRPAGVGLAEALITQREAIVAAMAEALASFIGEAAPVPTAEWAGQLLDGFAAAMKDGLPEGFLSTLGQVLRQVVTSGDPTGSAQRVSAWQEALSVLRSHLLPYLADNVEQSRAENLWQQARLFIAEAAQQAERYRELQTEQQTAALQAVEQTITTTADMDDLMDVIARELPRLGIPSTYLSLYAGQEMPPQECRLILACDENGRAALATDRVRFPARVLAPQGTLPQERSYRMVVEPLYFRERQLGLALFEVGPRDGAIYEMLREQISGALQVALLFQQVARRALQLQTAAEISRTATSVLDLSVLLQQVVELVQQRFDLYYVGLFLVSTEADGTWAMLRAASGQGGRQMLAQGHRLKVGSESMVGQCIADHQPRIASDVGEEAVRFDNPLLPETHSEMALPLVTREGAIGALSVQSTERAALGEAEIAVFETLAGQLANAIANARVYEQVAQAYTEIQVLNERLRDENLRMGAELAVTQRLQRMLLPTEEELRQIEELDIAGFMEPADEVGGDYYDVLNHNGQIKIGIGDVTGHGLESGVVMLMLQTAVRTLMTSDEQDPVRFLSILNRLLQENTQRMQVSKSMTLALLDYQIGQMRVSGQHEQVIVVRKGGGVELKDTLKLGFPLGLVTGVAEFVHETSIALQPGDGIVLYSDGITEAEDEKGELYGLERLCRVVSAHWDGMAEETKDAVIADVRAFIGEQKVYDDITLVVVKQR